MLGVIGAGTWLRYSKALLQPWKVGFSSLSAVDGRKHHLLDLQEIETVLTDVKADNVKVIPVPKHCDWADFMVLATGRSTWHVKNIAQALIYKAMHLPSFLYYQTENYFSFHFFLSPNFFNYIFCVNNQAKQKQRGVERMMLPSVEGQAGGKWIVIDSGCYLMLF